MNLRQQERQRKKRQHHQQMEHERAKRQSEARRKRKQANREVRRAAEVIRQRPPRKLHPKMPSEIQMERDAMESEPGRVFVYYKDRLARDRKHREERAKR